MSEHRVVGPSGPSGPTGIDREIDVHSIRQLGFWLAVVTVVSFLIGWGFYRGLASWERRLDLEASPLAEANRPVVPPGPRLLPHPETELAHFRALESARLGGWGWVDKSAGIAHVPIDRAIESVASSSRLPDWTPAAETEVETP